MLLFTNGLFFSQSGDLVMNTRTELVIAVAASLILAETALACGGGGGSQSIPGRSGPTGLLTFGTGFTPTQAAASQFSQALRQRSISAARLAQYNASLRAARLANAERTRQERIAKRETRAATRLAKLDAERNARQSFLANARTWTDSSGRYSLSAALVGSDEQSVRLKKADGSTVHVPHQRLSVSDRIWLASRKDARGDNGEMLASL